MTCSAAVISHADPDGSSSDASARLLSQFDPGERDFVTWGDRKSDRVQFQQAYPANLMGVDGTWRRSCSMLDVSSTGARVEIEGTTSVLQAKEFGRASLLF